MTIIAETAPWWGVVLIALIVVVGLALTVFVVLALLAIAFGAISDADAVSPEQSEDG